LPSSSVLYEASRFPVLKCIKSVKPIDCSVRSTEAQDYDCVRLCKGMWKHGGWPILVAKVVENVVGFVVHGAIRFREAGSFVSSIEIFECARVRQDFEEVRIRALFLRQWRKSVLQTRSCWLGIEGRVTTGKVAKFIKGIFRNPRLISPFLLSKKPRSHCKKQQRQSSQSLYLSPRSTSKRA